MQMILRRKCCWPYRKISINSSTRVSPAHFDADPERIEHQARMIVQTPDLLRIARRISEFAVEQPDELPEDLRPVARTCAAILRYVYQLNDAPETVAAE